MSDPKFCGVGNISVVVPYRDLERMILLARNMDSFKDSLSDMDKRVTALRYMYTELLEKVREMEKNL